MRMDLSMTYRVLHDEVNLRKAYRVLHDEVNLRKDHVLS